MNEVIFPSLLTFILGFLASLFFLYKNFSYNKFLLKIEFHQKVLTEFRIVQNAFSLNQDPYTEEINTAKDALTKIRKEYELYLDNDVEHLTIWSIIDLRLNYNTAIPNNQQQVMDINSPQFQKALEAIKIPIETIRSKYNLSDRSYNESEDLIINYFKNVLIALFGLKKY